MFNRPAPRLWIRLSVLTLGAAASAACIARAWGQTTLRWDLDGDVLAMTAWLLAPAGPAAALAIQLWAQFRSSPRGARWLWFLVAVNSAAWVEVFLDAGIYLGPWGKLWGGATALGFTPMLGLCAAGRGMWIALRKECASALEWAGLGVAIWLALGWVWFLRIMLALRF